MKKRKTLLALGSLALVAALAVGSTLAYLTDTETKENQFTVGTVDITVEEPSWPEPDPENPDEDLPNEDMNPFDTVAKDPQIVNNGSESAYVFFKVSVPYMANGHELNVDGTVKTTEEFADYFTLNEKNAAWAQVGTAEQVDGKNVYVYAYASNGALTPLTAGSTTPELFKSVTLRNIMELENLDASARANSIDVVGYAIQVKNIKDATGAELTDPAAVWQYVVNQEAAEAAANTPAPGPTEP